MYACFRCPVITIACYNTLKLVLLMAHKIQAVNCLRKSQKILATLYMFFLLMCLGLLWIFS